MSTSRVEMDPHQDSLDARRQGASLHFSCCCLDCYEQLDKFAIAMTERGAGCSHEDPRHFHDRIDCMYSVPLRSNQSVFRYSVHYYHAYQSSRGDRSIGRLLLSAVVTVTCGNSNVQIQSLALASIRLIVSHCI